MGHARALLSLADEADQRRVARDVIARSLSVRETESLVKKIVEAGEAGARSRRAEAGRRPHPRRGRSPASCSSAPASASSAREREGASRSISSPRTS